MGFVDFVGLMRPRQWYKNVLVFIALVFSGNLLNFSLWGSVLVGFVSLCLVSSASYVLNDIFDRKADRLNAEKRSRAVASGRVSVLQAVVFAFVLLLTGFFLASLLPTYFVVAVAVLFCLSFIYSLWLKHEPFVDVLLVSSNFVVRAVSGAFVIGVWVSPWLVMGVFFLALFLVVGKRSSELVLNNAVRHRKVLSWYSAEVVSQLRSVSMTALIMCYSLFAFFGNHEKLFITLPVAIYAIVRYSALISMGSVIARHPEKVFGDIRMVVAMLVWVFISLIVLYF